MTISPSLACQSSYSLDLIIYLPALKTFNFPVAYQVTCRFLTQTSEAQAL